MNMTPEEKAEFLQIYLDETEEELDSLVQTLLVLEENPDSHDHLNEAFRMVHSMKGAAGMMGFQDITALTHQLENRFERLRSGTLRLDQPTMAVSLKCIDFLRQCNEQLRNGEPFSSVVGLLDELHGLDATKPALDSFEAATPASVEEPAGVDKEPMISVQPESKAGSATSILAGEKYHLIVTFEPGMKLLDMKGQLVMTRIQELSDVIGIRPLIDELASMTGPVSFELLVASDQQEMDLYEAADVFGVTSVRIRKVDWHELPPRTESVVSSSGSGDGSVVEALVTEEKQQEPSFEVEVQRLAEPSQAAVPDEMGAVISDTAAMASDGEEEEPTPEPTKVAPAKTLEMVASETSLAADSVEAPGVPPTTVPEKKSKVAETVRVDIDRLDNLLNLAGELVVSKARFAQIASEMSAPFKQSNVSTRFRSFQDSFQAILHEIQQSDRVSESLAKRLSEMEGDLQDLGERWDEWAETRKGFTQLNETIDQLTRVSDSLQRGVLQTRMVPVGPLLNRFKRVVRDLAMEKEKKISLQIRGEKTELDKRMIDELGDPLVHLVRNSIDHGLELPEERIRKGKPESGTIVLEAYHSGNNVFIRIQDDGGGIRVDRVRERIVQRNLMPRETAEHLSDAQVIDYIWHPGFSTAAQVTNISGRGVGMDIVKTRIAELNGTIEVESTEDEGTTFTIRLPLTLAIISSLLFRIRSVVYSVPIDDVSEIVAIPESTVVTVHGKQTFCLRGQYLPLVGLNDLFAWHNVDYGHNHQTASENGEVKVVVLHTAGRSVGLRVDELIGGEDIVIKSLSENFINIRGLSGASILGDGRVSLLLDVTNVIELAVQGKRVSVA